MESTPSTRPTKRHRGHLIAMGLITLFAVALMIASVSKGRGEIKEDELVGVQDKPATVLISDIPQKTIEITDRYSGTIRPFERFAFSFENPGRVIEIGKNDRNKDLDEGDTVKAGQALAFLDTEALVARQEEINASLEFAQQEYQRALDLLNENSRAINEAEVLKRNRDRLMNLAQKKSIEKQLKDSTLRTTVDGVISKRWINPGELVNTQTPAFEVIQVEQVLLVLGVPESRIQRIPVPANAGSGSSAKVYVRLMGNGEFGLDEPEPLIGEVYRISQTSDRDSGQFEVEVLVDNPDGDLRPGMIAIADIVVNEIQGFQVPLSATVVRDNVMFLYAAQQQEERLVAKRFEVKRDNYEIQEDTIVIRELPAEYRRVITSGQHRLVDGRSLLDVGATANE